ncbi:acyltransferase [Solimonas sp. SE-A11]|uniref:acyltransferase n=1 Tax=Solimonas sp. SE-A11 TaxID=3054954 RepID=UPI00259C8652|nr:acyltransferase [Solimonas sp. SE-A11]MDM4769741.1 acyltransferase [Solimonas sp. SE-A11]
MEDRARFRLRAFGREGRIATLLREEIWMWFEASLAWVPGRTGRFLRGFVYGRLLDSDGPLDMEEGVYIRAPGLLRCGRRVSLGRDVQLNCRGGLTIGSNVMIGPGTRLLTNGHRMERTDIPMREQGLYDKPISIGDDVWIGANVMVLPGVTIGRGSVVAAGAVVTKDVPEYSLAVGVPAKPVKSRLTPPAA